MSYKPKMILLKSIPEDMYSELVRIQGEYKKKHLKQFSLEAAVYKFFKAHMPTIKDDTKQA